MHRVVVDAPGGELAATATFQQLIKPQDHRPRGHKGFDQQAQKHASGLPGRPPGPIEQPVVVLEAGHLGQAQGAQRGGEGVVSGGQQRAAH